MASIEATAPGNVERARVLHSFRRFGERLMQTLAPLNLPQWALDEAHAELAQATVMAIGLSTAAETATTTQATTKPPTEAQQKILGWLAENPNATRAQIAAGLGAGPHNIGRSIEGLVERGLVTFSGGPDGGTYSLTTGPEARAA